MCTSAIQIATRDRIIGKPLQTNSVSIGKDEGRIGTERHELMVKVV